MEYHQSAPITHKGKNAFSQDEADDPPPALDRDQVCLCINIWAAFYPERLTLARQVGRQMRPVDERGTRS